MVIDVKEKMYLGCLAQCLAYHRPSKIQYSKVKATVLINTWGIRTVWSGYSQYLRLAGVKSRKGEKGQGHLAGSVRRA